MKEAPIFPSLSKGPIMRRHRGAIIAYFLVLLAVLVTSLVTTMALTGGVETQTESLSLKRDQAFYTAEAGLQRALCLYHQTHTWRAPASSPLTGTITNQNLNYA
jgi:Tfp pilus assembly protein PilX